MPGWVNREIRCKRLGWQGTCSQWWAEDRRAGRPVDWKAFTSKICLILN